MSEWAEDGYSNRFLEVNANTLDGLLQQNGIKHADVSWIKIDVEGAEFEVLEGSHKIMSDSKNIAIIIEVHGSPQYYKPKVKEFLKSHALKIEFEKYYEDNGSMHMIARKSS